MNQLPLEKRAQILQLLCEGNSLRATSRIADVSINTVTRLLVSIGTAVSAYQYDKLVNLPCKRIQVDEIWAFCYAKQKAVNTAKNAPHGAGDIWTWVAIDPDTKLVPSWFVGDRDAQHAHAFLVDLAGRMKNRIQLTSDGLVTYKDAVHDAFLDEIDYAMLVKKYGEAQEQGPERRYSPAVCLGAQKMPVFGKPDEKHISTSMVERQNLTMRMHMRRFTRLTNAFSKKAANHCHAIALHFMFYNFAKIHKSLRVTPAMAAGVTDHVWTFEEIAALAPEVVARKRGPYKKRLSTENSN